MTTVLIPICVLVPICGGIGIYLFRGHSNVRDNVTLLTAISLFSVVCVLFNEFIHNRDLFWHVIEMTPNLNILFRVEPLGLLFALVASFLWIVTSIYAIGYMRGHHEKNQTRFFIYFAIAISCAIGIAFSGNLLTLFIFYEALTISTFPLVTHSGSDEAKKAGRLYLGILIGTSICFQLVAIIWIWTLTGSLEFHYGGILKNHVNPATTGIILILFVFGVGKAAIMPFHKWLPSAMVAPTPVSALLHAVAVVKAGVFTILKVVIYIFGIDYLKEIEVNQWLQIIACVTIVLSSLIALTKNNLKARLAYSTVGQLSYIVLAALMANQLAAVGGAMHIVSHAFGKITLFFCAGSILVATHYTEVSQMNGLGRKMPLTFLCFLIGSLSIIGLPPFCGLWSKWFILLGAAELQNFFFIFVLILSSLLNVAYLIPIFVRGFFPHNETTEKDSIETKNQVYHKRVSFFSNSTCYKEYSEAPVLCLLSTGLSAIGCLILFIYGDSTYEFVLLTFGASHE